MQTIWLASYPRSGNTLLRTVLWNCFGLRSGSIYPNDLGGNKSLEEYVGHIEQSNNGGIPFEAGDLPLVKTHSIPGDDMPAIYIVRDGRAAIVSFWKFYKAHYGKKLTFETCIEGQHYFGTWESHINAWKPWDRPKTLLLRYEDLRDNLPRELTKISTFLNRDIIGFNLPPREEIAAIDGQFVRTKNDWMKQVNPAYVDMMNKRFGPILRKLGYSLS